MVHAAPGTVPLCLGTARLGSLGARLGLRASVDLVHEALERGITHVDTADAYGAGASEWVLGRALRGRDAVTIATKGGYRFEERSGPQVRARMAVAPWVARLRRRPASGVSAPASTQPPAGYQEQDFHPAQLEAALVGSLRRLQRDHVGRYQLHGPPPELRTTLGDDILDWASTAIERGLIGTFGVGAESLAQATPWLGSLPASSAQIPFGVLDPEAADGFLDAAAAAGCAVIARGVMGAGLLGGQADPSGQPAATRRRADAVRSLAHERGLSVADLALGFVRAYPQVTTIVVGVTSSSHLDELTAAATRPLDPEVLERVGAIATGVA
ncbi:MAG: aldo/keto reductase [Desertimonas sp.]